MTVYTLDPDDYSSGFADLNQVLTNIDRLTGFYWDLDELLSAADIAELGEDLINLVDILDSDLNVGRPMPTSWQPTPRLSVASRPEQARMDRAVALIEQLVCFYYTNYTSLTTSDLARITTEVIVLVGTVDYGLRQGHPLPYQWSVSR